MRTGFRPLAARRRGAWRRRLAAWALALALGLGGAVASASGVAPEAGTMPPEQLRSAYAVVVAGAGTGGLGAAIQAARLGASVLLLEETDWVGGQMLAAAVSAIDEGGAGYLVRGRGLYREFLQRVEAVYLPQGLDPLLGGRVANFRVEPRVGREVVLAMLAEARRGATLDLGLRARVVRVVREGSVVRGVEIECATPAGAVRRTLTCQVLIDATEWGDVLPLSGARYRAGNHLSEALDPTRRIQENTWTAVIRFYPEGVPARLRLAQPPPGYAERRAAFAQAIVPGQAPHRRGQPMSAVAFVDYRGTPDRALAGLPRGADWPPVTRTSLNYTNDYPCTVAYLEDPAQRQRTDRAMRLRTLQLLYFVQQELGLDHWSVAEDEGFDTPYNRAAIDAWLRESPELEPYRAILYHFSVLPYVRESRRLVGLHTLTAREISRGPGRAPQAFPTTVCLGDYRLDLHGGRGAADLELDLDRLADLEDAQPGRAGPFAIPAECLIPVTIDGLLAAEKNFSQTRLVNGATRMQPHTLNLGQAAGALAALAVRHGVPPRRIDPVLIQRAVLEARSTLALAPLTDVPATAPDWPALQLAVVRGWLTLAAGGRSEPRQPLRRREGEAALARLRSLGADPAAPEANPGAGAAPAAAETAETAAAADAPVTRAEFAQALAAASAPAVRLVFASPPAEAARPITRSEAAQVWAECLEARALSQLSADTPVVRWSAPRPTSAPTTVADDAGLGRLLQRLQAAGIIAEIGYWQTHAVTGETCAGTRVAELLLRGAQVIEARATPADMLTVLAQAHVISAPDTWARTAVPGGSCAGRNVAALLRNLAANPAVQRRAALAAGRSVAP